MAKTDAQVRFSIVDGVSQGLRRIVGGLKDAGEAITFITEGAARLPELFGTLSGATFLRDSVSQAAELEDAIARVAGATGATAEEFVALRAAAEQAALGSRASVNDAAEALNVLAREGSSAAEAIAALPQVLALADAAGLSAAQAAEQLASTLDLFGQSAAQSGAAADLLAAAALKSGTSVTGLVASLSKVGPVASQNNLSLEQTAAALGALAQRGIEGGRAGRALAEVLTALNDPASQFSQELTRLGITSRDFGTVISELAARGKAGEAALNALGNNGTIALRTLTAGGGAALKDLQADLRNVAGAAEAAAEPLRNTLNAALERVGEQFDIVRRSLVEPLLAPIADELVTVGKALEDFGKSPAFAEIKEALRAVFTEGAVAVKQFLADFDFQAASAAVADFARAVRENVGGIFTVLEGAADLIAAVSGGIRAAFNGLTAALNIIVGAFARGASQIAGIGAGISDTLADLSADLENVSEGAFSRAEQDLKDFAAAAGDTGDALVDLAGGTQRTAAATQQLAGTTTAAASGLQQQASAAKAAAAGTAELAGSVQQVEQAAVAPEVALAKLNAQLARLIENGQQGTEEYRRLVAEIAKYEAQLNANAAALAQSQADQAARIRETNAAIAQQADAAQAASTASAQAADAAAAAGDASAQAGEQASSAAGGIVGLLQALRQFYGDVSANALNAFETSLNRTVANGTTSLRALASAVERADQDTSARLENQRAVVGSLGQAYEELAGTADDADVQLSRLGTRSSEQLRQFAQAVREGRTQIDLLGQADLDALAASAERAADRVARIEENARRAAEQLADLGDQLQDELDREAGNEEAIARRRLERRLREIEDLEKAAGAAGAAQAAEARQRAEALYQQELRRIRERADAEIDADNRVADNRRQIESDRNGGGQGGGGGGRASNAVVPAVDGGGARVPASFDAAPAFTININGVVAADLNEFAERVTPAINRVTDRLARTRR